MSVKFQNLKSYIREKSFPEPNSGCWIWSAQTDKDGYGQFRKQYPGQWHKAHRVSFEAFYGSIPNGCLVLHKCNVPNCVNPEHLYAGTPLDNTADMIRAGRRNNDAARKGLLKSKMLRSKRTGSFVRLVRRMMMQYTRKQIASVLCVSKSTIDRSLRGEIENAVVI